VGDLVKSFSSLHWFYLLAMTATAACGGRGSTAAQLPGVERAPARAAATPLRRLTREQYRNTVRDLLGVKDLGTDLAVDEGIAGFFGNTIAPVSELHLEKYGRAADLIARNAVTDLRRLLPCDPAKVGEPVCAREFIERFGRRAFRRPLDTEESALYQRLFAAGRAQGGFSTGVRLVLQAMLQSPSFIYLVEPVGAVRAVVGAPERVPPFALATRLAYFLWNTTPDETLLAAAEANRLSTREEVAGQVQRMMADGRFGDTVATFHLQWLDLTELDGVEKRGKLYPKWSHELRAAMREETVRFVDHVVRRGDGRLGTLLGSRTSFLSGKLFDLYGLPEPGGGGWQQVDVSPAKRAGVLTQASVMTMHAHWDKPSLVLRGKMIREKLFCTTLPPPPPEVNNTLPQADATTSVRERFEDHRADVGCSKCHRLIDPLGIPFENYDAIGAFRTMDGPAQVDPSSDLDGTSKANGPVKDAIELVDRLAAADEVRDCVALQWFRFGVGRDEKPEDDASLVAIRDRFRQSGNDIPALVAAIALSDAFRYQKGQ
jgi:hypothetical protein